MRGRPAEIFLRRRCWWAASRSELLTVTALLVASPSTPTATLTPTITATWGVPYVWLGIPFGLRRILCINYNASLTAMAKGAAHCHLPRARARAARTLRTSPPTTDYEQSTPVGHPVKYTPYPFSLPFYVPWPLPYADSWAQRSPLKRRKTWATLVVLSIGSIVRFFPRKRDC